MLPVSPEASPWAVSPVGPKSAVAGMVTAVAGIVPWAVASHARQAG